MSTILMSINYYYIYLKINFDKNIPAAHRQFQKTENVFSNDFVLHQHSTMRSMTIFMEALFYLHINDML